MSAAMLASVCVKMGKPLAADAGTLFEVSELMRNQSAAVYTICVVAFAAIGTAVKGETPSDVLPLPVCTIVSVNVAGG